MKKEKSKLKTRQEIKSENREKEKAYIEGLQSFKTNFAENIKEIKKQLIDLAKKLETAGTIKTDRICQRIIDDLEYEIIAGQLDPDFIREALPEKYLDASYRGRGRRRWGEWQGGNLTMKLYAILEDFTTLDAMTIGMSNPERVVQDSRNHRLRMISRWNDKQIVDTIIAAMVASQVFADTATILKQVADQRRSSAELAKR